MKMFNTRTKSLVIKSAVLRSLINGKEIVAKIEKYDARNLELQGKSLADIYFFFEKETGNFSNNTERGVTLDDFERGFSQFEITIDTNRKKFKFQYCSNTTRSWVTEIKIGLMTPPPPDKAKVLPIS